MTWKVGTAAVAAATALFIAATPPALARDRHHGHRGDNVGAGIAGFAAGAILGGALASQPRYYDPGYRAYYPRRSYRRAVRWCMEHYRSYDPRSGTYLGYDGRRHACP